MRWTPVLMAAAALCLAVGCAGDKDDDDDEEDGASSTTEVSGSFTRSDGESVSLVGGGAYYDLNENGALHVFLTDFDTTCAAVADGLGFNAASGGIYLAFYTDLPDDPFSAGVYVHDGEYQVNWEESIDYEVVLDAETPSTSGTITLADDRGTIDFTVPHCGDVEPFFR